MELTDILKTEACNTALSSSDYTAHQAWRYNSAPGALTGADCPLCRNKGYIMVIDSQGYTAIRECSCMEKRRLSERIEKSGISQLLDSCRFDTYQVSEDWQKRAKEQAEAYVKDFDRKWFFIGGQSGCGKTHLCTAIVGKLLENGYRAYYMLWRDEIVPLKASVTDEAAYSRLINKLKTVPVLYIDDFLKTERGKLPTTADINLAFEILNYRDMAGLPTLISSELLLDDIIGIDEAIGGRIYRRAKDFCLSIATDRRKNYRLKG